MEPVRKTTPKPKKHFWRTRYKILSGMLLLILASFMVPQQEYPEDSVESFKKFDSLRLSKAGDVLLLRSDWRDYEFQVPPNQLGQAFALNIGNLYNRLNCKVGAITVHPDGQVSAVLDVYYGGYFYGDENKMRSVITPKERHSLQTLGFEPTNLNYEGEEIKPELYMRWRRVLLLVQQYPSRSMPEGLELDKVCTAPTTQVRLLSPEELASNKRWNAVFSPFIALRHGIETSLFYIAILLGPKDFHLGPSG